MAYQIFTDATADASASMLEGLPHVVYIPMSVEIGARLFVYGPGGNLTVPEFYTIQREGQFASTSQINTTTYINQFEPYLHQGIDILYLCFSSGLSGTIQSAKICMDVLKDRYPERKIVLIDTLCASVGQGLLVAEAAKRQAAGDSLEELTWWATNNRMNICHWFTVDVFDHLKHGGRVSSAAASVGTMLRIKPMLHVDEAGKLEVVEKPRGSRKAMSAQLARMAQGWRPDISRWVLIGHGDSLDAAEQLRQKVIQLFPEAIVYIADIGPIIGAHTGPGMLALIYWGDNR